MVEIANFKSGNGVFAKRPWAWEALESGTLEGKAFWSGFFSENILATVFKSLQIVPMTSAQTERNWSIHGAIHTKSRNW